jgi:hypothetical protein
VTAAHVPLVLEAVECLEAELLRIHHATRAIAAWPTDSAAEIASIRAAIRRACDVTRGITNNLLASSEGAASDALRASSLRARGIVLAVELSALEHGARGLAGSPPNSRFADVSEFKEYLVGEISRINAHWLTESRHFYVQHGASVRELLDHTEAAYAALGREPNVAGFLAWAVDRESYALRCASRVLATLLEVSLPSEVTDDEPTRIEVPGIPSLLARLESRSASKEEE